jgi:6-phosphogluconolactonase (cycloisomerase 2 family)
MASGAWSGTQAISGSQSVTPTAAGSDSYEITCTNSAGGSASSTAVLTVNNPAPVVTISITPTPIVAGSSATLTWSVTNATSCTASGAWTGTEPASGTATETPTQAGTFTYTLDCTGPGGSDTESAMLTVTTPASAAFVYTADSDNTVAGFGEAQGTGQLTLLANSPFSPGVTNMDAILADPALNLLFVASTTGNGSIASLTVDPSTGNLTATGNTTVTPELPMRDGMALGPNGNYLYVTGEFATLMAYSIAPGGALTPLSGSPYDVPCIGGFCGNDNLPDEMAYDAADTTLYIINSDDWTVAAYSVASDGSLTYIDNTYTSEVSPSDADVPDGIAISPNGKFLYTANGDSNDISAFAITPSATSGGNPEPLTYLAGTPFANTGGGTPYSPAIEPTGHYLYVNNYNNESISAFSIDQTSGALTELGSPVSIQAAVGQNFQLAIDPTGSYLYVANAGGKGNIPAFSIDPATGALTPLANSPFAMGTGVTGGPAHIAIFNPKP